MGIEQQYNTAYTESPSAINPNHFLILAGVLISGVAVLMSSGDGAPLEFQWRVLKTGPQFPCEGCHGFGVKRVPCRGRNISHG